MAKSSSVNLYHLRLQCSPTQCFICPSPSTAVPLYVAWGLLHVPCPNPVWIGINLSPRLLGLELPYWSALEIVYPVFISLFSVSLLQWLEVLWGPIFLYLLHAFHHLIIDLFFYHRTGIGNSMEIFVWVFFFFSSLLFCTFIYFTYIFDVSFFLSGKKNPILFLLLLVFFMPLSILIFSEFLEFFLLLFVTVISKFILYFTNYLQVFGSLYIPNWKVSSLFFNTLSRLYFLKLHNWYITHLYLDICHYSPCKTEIKYLKSRSPV